MAEFEAVIGLEVHCQLATQSKIFCSCPTGSGSSVAEVDVNSRTCPVCAGHPGTLPALNQTAVEYAIRAGLATNSTIRLKSVFSRKNYFYPDLPKGYQISQYDLPLCENGHLDIETSSGTKRITIQRIHMEEDAGKNVHFSDYSLVNLNRAGTPLVEIVSGPDMRTPEEAGAYMRALYAVVTYLGICDGNLQEGNFRCDANVSVRPMGSEKFGTRTEIKNVNSFRFVEKAIEYEIRRQIDVIEAGGKIVQETRLYDSQKNITQSMRSKEEAEDYRYFPEPDLIPLRVTEAQIEAIRGSLPELPSQKRARMQQEFGLSAYDAGVLTSSKEMALFFESVLDLLGGGAGGRAKTAANFMTGEVARLLNEEGTELSESKLKPEHIAQTVQLVQAATISNTGAKQILAAAWKTGESAQVLVDRLGLAQVSDSAALDPIIDQVITANPKQAEEFRGGKDKLLGFFVGQVMKATQGKANPALLPELVAKRLKG